jgi:hypothetical protein
VIKQQLGARAGVGVCVPVILPSQITSDGHHRQALIFQGAHPLIVRRWIYHDAAVDGESAKPGARDHRRKQHQRMLPCKCGSCRGAGKAHVVVQSKRLVGANVAADGQEQSKRS